jgi:hypothetical protein
MHPLTMIAIGALTGPLGPWVAFGMAAAALSLLLTVVAACSVLTWHGLRGTNPGPAGALLLRLVELFLRRGGKGR